MIHNQLDLKISETKVKGGLSPKRQKIHILGIIKVKIG